VIAHEPQMVRSFDGTFIAARSFGEADRIPVLLCNAIGANLSIWEPSLAQLADSRRVVTWDHRGMFDSGLPASDRLDASAHVSDAIATVRALGIERFHVVAWSSGGRIALELAQEYPERVVSLGLVCAGYGHSLAGLLRLELASLLPRIAGIARFVALPLHGLLRSLLSRPEVAGLVRQSGMIGASADTAAFIGFLRGLSECDPRILLQSYHAVSGDPAPHLLREIVAPALVIAGEHDQFTTRTVTTEIVAKIADARLEVYEDSTHYLPIEQPDRLAYDLKRFFKEIENTLS
jgi:3-oxoadipate enol-lactonase